MKNKTLILIGVLLCVAATGAVEKRFELPVAKVTIKVLDESKVAVPEADVLLGFRDPLTKNDAIFHGQTNADGLLTAEGGCAVNGLGNHVHKSGYYLGWADIPVFRNVDALNHWQPWDATYEVVLRPIGKPVAMYAKTGWFEVPAIGEPCGYDLEKGDWVSPHGNGVTTDILFTLTRRYVSRDDFDVSVEVRFSNPLDGIQETQFPEIGRNSVFKWPREAPDTGYEASLKTRFTHDPKTGFAQSATESQAYFFRVRTVEQNGQIVSALYGKIKGGLRLAPFDSKTCEVILTYYLNPTPLDRNMEWDPKQNLLEGLNFEETPREP